MRQRCCAGGSGGQFGALLHHAVEALGILKSGGRVQKTVRLKS
jgi:hypothetical protein